MAPWMSKAHLCLSIYLPGCSPISVHLYVLLSVCTHACLYTCLSTCLDVHLSIQLSPVVVTTDEACCYGNIDANSSPVLCVFLQNCERYGFSVHLKTHRGTKDEMKTRLTAHAVSELVTEVTDVSEKVRNKIKPL